jgi:hypothetical protein
MDKFTKAYGDSTFHERAPENIEEYLSMQNTHLESYLETRTSLNVFMYQTYNQSGEYNKYVNQNNEYNLQLHIDYGYELCQTLLDFPFNDFDEEIYNYRIFLKVIEIEYHHKIKYNLMMNNSINFRNLFDELNVEKDLKELSKNINSIEDFFNLYFMKQTNIDNLSMYNMLDYVEENRDLLNIDYDYGQIFKDTIKTTEIHPHPSGFGIALSDKIEVYNISLSNIANDYNIVMQEDFNLSTKFFNNLIKDQGRFSYNYFIKQLNLYNIDLLKYSNNDDNTDQLCSNFIFSLTRKAIYNNLFLEIEVTELIDAIMKDLGKLNDLPSFIKNKIIILLRKTKTWYYINNTLQNNILIVDNIKQLENFDESSINFIGVEFNEDELNLINSFKSDNFDSRICENKDILQMLHKFQEYYTLFFDGKIDNDFYTTNECGIKSEKGFLEFINMFMELYSLYENSENELLYFIKDFLDNYDNNKKNISLNIKKDNGDDLNKIIITETNKMINDGYSSTKLLNSSKIKDENLKEFLNEDSAKQTNSVLEASKSVLNLSKSETAIEIDESILKEASFVGDVDGVDKKTSGTNNLNDKFDVNNSYGASDLSLSRDNLENSDVTNSFTDANLETTTVYSEDNLNLSSENYITSGSMDINKNSNIIDSDKLIERNKKTVSSTSSDSSGVIDSMIKGSSKIIEESKKESLLDSLSGFMRKATLLKNKLFDTLNGPVTLVSEFIAKLALVYSTKTELMSSIKCLVIVVKSVIKLVMCTLGALLCLANKFINLFTTTPGEIFKKIENTFDNLKDLAVSITDSIESNVSSGIDNIKSLFSNTSNKSILDKIVDDFFGGCSKCGLAANVSTKLNNVKDKFNKGLNSTLNKSKKCKFRTPSLAMGSMRGLRYPSLNFPKLPNIGFGC